MKYFENTALFANDAKTVITVDVEENGMVFNRAIEVSPNKHFKDLMEHIDLEKVKENTTAYNEEVIKAEDAFVDGLLNKVEEKVGGLNKQSTTTSLFDISENELFDIKLKTFEIPEVKAASKEMKASIRKSKNIFETLAYTVAAIVKNT